MAHTEVEERQDLEQRYPIGTRVRVESGDRSVYLGKGTISEYVEKEFDSGDLGLGKHVTTVPKIDMDDGTIQWGYTCWWQDVETYLEMYREVRAQTVEEQPRVNVCEKVIIASGSITDMELDDDLVTTVVVTTDDDDTIRMTDADDRFLEWIEDDKEE